MATVSKLVEFTFDGAKLRTEFIETIVVKEGVSCDVYRFVNDGSKDLAIVRVAKERRTPLQRVLLGAKTIEGFVSGEGTLTVRSADGEVRTRKFKPGNSGEVIVNVGDTMQWQADGEGELTFYEVCEPPYVDGRFENLPE